MVVRMPSSADYACQVEKEHQWLPQLAPHLPLLVPEPLAIGKTDCGYEHLWSVYRWIEGKMSSRETITDLPAFAKSLAHFLLALHEIDACGGPALGLHSFFRGGSLAVYDEQVKQALNILQGKIDTQAAIRLWNTALASCWDRGPVWVHGDISLGNLLVQNSRLHAVIDFGQLTTGHPASDLTINWTLFKDESREIF
jgi:aminoglycoside phosphotransferase (APT) family kinase protein